MKLLAFIALVVLAVACSKNDDEKGAKTYTVNIQPTVDTAQAPADWEWAYISLADGTVALVEPAEWDIAVLRYMYVEMAIKTPSDTAVKPIKFMQGRSIGETNIVWSGVEALDFGFDKMPPQYTSPGPHTWGTHTVQFTAYDYTTGELTFEVE